MGCIETYIVYKIYPDVKTECERDYIKDRGGLVIKVNRPTHKKTTSPLSKDIDYQEDMIINSVEGLYDIENTIYCTCMNIMNRN